MDFVIGISIGLSFLGSIYVGVHILHYGLGDSIKDIKKLFGPKYRIRKNQEGFYYAEERTLFRYLYCIHSINKNIKSVESYIQNEINGKYGAYQDEIIEVDISTTSIVTIKE